MGYLQALRDRGQLYFIKCVAVTTMMFLVTSAGAAQAAPPGQPQVSLPGDLKNNPGLMAEFGQLMEKLQHDIQLPPARGLSRLLPLLPESTVFYAAFPNYGDASHQALTIFRQEVRQSPVLQAWWQHGELAANGPKVEDFLEKFYQLSQYLGDEIVLSGTIEGGHDPSLLLVAEVRKPGLKDFLQRTAADLAGKSRPAVRVLDVRELAVAKDTQPVQQQLVVLVRPDFVVGALDVAALRRFSARLDTDNREFISTAFGQRLAQAYEGGTSVVAGADLQKILSQVPPGGGPNQKVFQQTGFADMKYLVWERKNVAGQAISQMELSFIGPRHGVASWLAAPGSLGSLDFVSPKAVMAGAVQLKNPAEIFDDLKDLSTASNPNAFAALAAMEAAWKLSLREDLLSRLGGEIAFEVDSLIPEPAWRVMLQVNDPDRLQATLSAFLAARQVSTEQFEEGGLTFHTLHIPSALRKTFEISYAFVDGYLVIASSRDSLAEAIRLHRTGESLAKSGTFLASLPPGHQSEASGLLYEDPVAMIALSMRQLSPEVAESLSHAKAEAKPVEVFAYGEESAIREVSRSGSVDAGAVMVVAAIAIPNLLRARMAANEASAVGAIRTVNTAQVIYSNTYPQKGYAHDLATLGPGPSAGGSPSANHANVLDSTLGNASCTAGTWCTKSGFRFTIAAVCAGQHCDKFVVVGAPETSSTGSRSFCSTSDGVIRFKIGPPLTSPVTVAECQAWRPLQ
jgi:hypothetical protein